MMRKPWMLILVAMMMGILMISPNPIKASTLSYTLCSTFSNDTTPSSTAPWLTLLFDDGDDADNTVQLTMTASLEYSTEFIGSVYINFNEYTGFVGSDFSFDQISALGASTITVNENSLKPDGDGNFDIAFSFNNGVLDDFVAITYDITFDDATTLYASDFSGLSVPGPGSTAGPFHVAAHLQGIPTGAGSTWIAECTSVPDASVMLLLGSSFLGLAVFSRKRKTS